MKIHMNTNHAPLKPGFIFVPVSDSSVPANFSAERRGASGYFARLIGPDTGSGFEPVTFEDYQKA